MRVSVGIPFYNNQDTLLTAIRSVFAQTYQDWELILVDDGSRDNSLTIAQSIRDNRVKVIHDGENHGLAYRLNQIASLATGEYLARMDADDMMHPQRLEKQLNYLQANPQIDVLASPVYSINQENQPQGIRGLDPIEGMTVKTVLLNKGLIIHPTVMAKTQWFRRYQYDTLYRKTQDRELWCRSASTSTFAKIPEPLYFYRENLFNSQSYLKSYLVGSQANFKLLKTYGWKNLGTISTLVRMLRIPLKIVTYQLFILIGKENLLISQRDKPISESEFIAATKVIESILASPLPD